MRDPKCIKVYLNINGILKEQIMEQCWNYPFYSNEPKPVVINISNYNLRFSPDTDPLKGDEKETFTFRITESTNIIAQIKMGSKINILSELIQWDRSWLFIEVDLTFLVDKDHPVNFDFKDQQLRGWISSKYVTRK